MGAEPEQFAAGALKLVQAGFDVIDINFGCPVKKVLGRCRGGFHLSQPEVALEIVRRTRDAVPPHIPVTVKMRRGIDDSAESRDKFFTILDGAFAAGVAAITVHGRTVDAALRRPQPLGVSARSEAARRPGADDPRQRRPVHGPELPRHDAADGRRWRDRRPRRDRQPVDLRPVPGPRRRRAAAAAAHALRSSAT